MSDQEKTFIRQLKITLIAILGPFVLATAGSAVSDHYNIKSNQRQIEALESTMVDRKLMIQYVDELRRLSNAIKQDVNRHEMDTDTQIADVNKRIDLLVREVYQHQTRSVPKDLQR